MAELIYNLPELGDSDNAEATVSFIIVDPDEDVAEGDALIEMTTDKASFEVPSPCNGRIKEILVEEDQVVKVGEPICIIETE